MKLDSSAFVADQELIRALKGRSTPVDCDQDRELFSQGDAPTGVYILLGGTIMLSMRSTSGESLMNTPALPGSLLGLPGLIGNAAYSLSAHALKGAEVSFVSREEFTRLMLNEPPLSVLILRVLAAEVRTARRTLTNA